MSGKSKPKRIRLSKEAKALAYWLTAPNAFIEGKQPISLLKENPEHLVSLLKQYLDPAGVF